MENNIIAKCSSFVKKTRKDFISSLSEILDNLEIIDDPETEVVLSIIIKKPQETHEEKCPHCGSKNFDWDTFEMEDGNSGYFNITCIDCGFEGKSWHKLVFEEIIED